MIIDEIIESRKGHYTHALEVEDVYELESIIEGVIGEFGTDNYTDMEFIEFFNTMELYCLNESEESEVYDFDFSEYIKGTI